MYKEILEENNVTQTPELTLSILTYEVGKLHQILVYRGRFGKAGYLGEERVELGDALTMIKLLIEQKGHDISVLEKEGLERFKYRIGEVKRAEMKRKYGDE